MAKQKDKGPAARLECQFLNKRGLFVLCNKSSSNNNNREKVGGSKTEPKILKFQLMDIIDMQIHNSRCKTLDLKSQYF